MPGIIQNVLPLVGPGQDAAIAKIGGQTTIVASVTGGALEELGTNGEVLRTMQQIGPQAFGAGVRRDRPHRRAQPVRVGVDRRPARDRHARRRQVRALAQPGREPAAGRAELPLQPPDRRLRRLDRACRCRPSRRSPTTTSSCRPTTSPRSTRCLPSNQIVAGTGLGLLHAYDGATGLDVAGLPEGDRRLAVRLPPRWRRNGRMADMTREGYLFQWQTEAPACQPQWPTFRHDQQDSGNYDHDGTPPNAASNISRHLARRRRLPPVLHCARRRRPVRHAGLLRDAGERGQAQPRPAPVGGRQRVQRRSDAALRLAPFLGAGARRGRQPRAGQERSGSLGAGGGLSRSR